VDEAGVLSSKVVTLTAHGVTLTEVLIEAKTGGVAHAT
jgi:hypothetical protein